MTTSHPKVGKQVMRAEQLSDRTSAAPTTCPDTRATLTRRLQCGERHADSTKKARALNRLQEQPIRLDLLRWGR
jgi:hypothetical protein